MYHTTRRWCLQRVTSADELADKLLDYSWCCCTAFELEGCLWLNDATSADGLQEYAVLHRPTENDQEFLQVESITVSWCNRDQLLAFIHDLAANRPALSTSETAPVVRATSISDLYQSLGALDKPLGWKVEPRLESPTDHGNCAHCA